MAGGAHRISDYDLILGNLICDRLGLDPAHMKAEPFEEETANRSTVVLTGTTLHFIPVEDLMELKALAHERYMAGQPVG